MGSMVKHMPGTKMGPVPASAVQAHERVLVELVADAVPAKLRDHGKAGIRRHLVDRGRAHRPGESMA